MVEVLALLMWRRVPVTCFVVAEVALVCYGVLGYPTTPAGYAGLVATGVASWGGRGAPVRYACLIASIGGVVVIGVLGYSGVSSAAVTVNAVLVLAAWLVGRLLRSYQEVLAFKAQEVHEAVRREAAETHLMLVDALHDRVGHTIVGVLRQLEAAEALGAEAGSALRERASDRLREALGEIAGLVATSPRHPRPRTPRTDEGSEPLEQVPSGSLGEALRSWVSTLRSFGTAVQLSVHAGGAEDLSPEVETVLAAVVNEALANVARHSAATQVALTLTLEPDAALLEVSDPGPPRPGTTGSRSGLARLREVIAAQGGMMTAASTPAGGFRFDAHLPLARPTEEALS